MVVLLRFHSIKISKLIKHEKSRCIKKAPYQTWATFIASENMLVDFIGRWTCSRSFPQEVRHFCSAFPSSWTEYLRLGGCIFLFLLGLFSQSCKLVKYFINKLNIHMKQTQFCLPKLWKHAKGKLLKLLGSVSEWND